MAPGVELDAQLVALHAVAARVPGGLAGLSCASDADLVEVIRTAQALVRSAEGVVAAAAGEVERRSQAAGAASMAQRFGARSAKGLVAATAGIGFGEASRVVEVGTAVRPRAAISGEALPARREHVATAVASGALSLGLAELIDATLRKVARVVVRDKALVLEQALVEQAVSGTFSVADFTAYCKRLPNRLDPDGAQPREEQLRANATIQEQQLATGMLRIVIELDPELAGFWRAALRAKTNPRRRTPDLAADMGTDADTGSRTDGDRAAQSAPRAPGAPTAVDPVRAKLDALTAILRGSLRDDDGRSGGVDTTMLVRIDLDDLLRGIGTATIDGIDEPISAATARRLACDADLIPQVFNGKSQLLDQGESHRIFTRAQRYAILGSFTGCAFPLCDMPTTMTEIHHVGSWATRHRHRRGTDLLNGIPLCGTHNRLMERGWSTAFDDDHVPWFTPPPEIDPHQQPRRGGNLVDRRAA